MQKISKDIYKMKATDLMIDDWVEYGEYITTVRNLSDVIVLSGCIGRLEEVRPVPLTPEILEKNGFVLVDNDLFEREINAGHSIQYDILHCHFDEYEETGYEEPIEEHNFHCELVSKVHELQHALRLCGLAELADNFKV